MLTEKQISEIQEHLDKAQNPLFFFDNDDDGLMSFLLLRRFIERGKGVAVKGARNLGKGYCRKINELKPDYIFILDVPVVEQEFFDKIKEDNLPIVWIDHHNIETPVDKDIHYYNSYSGNEQGEPVSYLSYKISNRKEDIWLAVIGCISDCYMPDFYQEFADKYPELAIKNPKSPFDVLYNSEIGRMAHILDYSLKDKTTNVVNMLRFMMQVKGPIDVLEENYKTQQIFKRYNEINAKYQQLMKKARQLSNEKLIYFQYSGDLSLSGNLSNELIYEFPDKIIVVAYVNKNVANISMRGRIDVRDITLKAIEGIKGAVGGGHLHATGAKMNSDDLPVFKKKVEELVGG